MHGGSRSKNIYWITSGSGQREDEIIGDYSVGAAPVRAADHVELVAGDGGGLRVSRDGHVGEFDPALGLWIVGFVERVGFVVFGAFAAEVEEHVVILCERSA